MKETFRWFGPNDPVSLAYIRQAGATGVVTALHHVPNGEVWEKEEVLKTKAQVEAAGMEWSFIESIPVHENIKLRQGDYKERLDRYKQSIRNVAACGVRNICYNYMPVLDWTRTHLFWPLPNGATALRFDKVDMAVFEKYILERKDVERDYSEGILKRAAERFSQMRQADKDRLQEGVLKGLPGTVDDLTIPVFREMLAGYDGMDHAGLKSSLSEFLNEVVPVAEECGVKMAIHPDDPPFDIMGLPRVVTSESDLEDLVGYIDSPSNGITFCTGSLGANPRTTCPL